MEYQGFRNDVIQNMCTINPMILSRDPETELKPTVEFLKKLGIDGKMAQLWGVPLTA